MQDTAYTMTKKENKEMINVVLQRIKDTKQFKKNSLLLEAQKRDDFFSTCKTQASLIDACFQNRLTVIDCAKTLVKYNLCSSFELAMKRVKRHVSNDVQSRVLTRNMRMRMLIRNAEDKQKELATE